MEMGLYMICLRFIVMASDKWLDTFSNEKKMKTVFL